MSLMSKLLTSTDKKQGDDNVIDVEIIDEHTDRNSRS